MKTRIVIEVEHHKSIPHLGDMIAGRAYTIQGVTNAELVSAPSEPMEAMRDEGFSLAELSLGSQEVHRS